jgi:hypothetical protein
MEKEHQTKAEQEKMLNNIPPGRHLSEAILESLRQGKLRKQGQQSQTEQGNEGHLARVHEIMEKIKNGRFHPRTKRAAFRYFIDYCKVTVYSVYKNIYNCRGGQIAGRIWPAMACNKAHK